MKKFVVFPWYYVIPILVTSYFSVGFFHYDEHYQLLEFANYKMRLSPLADLPWEYNARIRPSFQVWFVLGIWKLYNYIAAFNPFVLAFILRFLTALLTIFTLVQLQIGLLPHAHSKQLKIYYFTAFILWFMPYVAVRYSSETWSGLFLALGFVAIFRIQKSNSIINYILGGLLLVISFWCRFQIAFAIAGMGLWMLYSKKYSVANYGAICFGFCIGLYFGYYLDTIFYHENVFSPYRYYYANIVQNIAANFGTYGVWYYPAMYLLDLFPLISFPMFYILFRSFKHNVNSPVFWACIIFIIPHFVMPHKEFRFLFPLFVFLPLMISYEYERVYLLMEKFQKTSQFLLILNGILLFLVMIKPADIRIFNLKQVSENGTKAKNIVIKNGIDTKYFPNLHMNFYANFEKDSSSNTIEYELIYSNSKNSTNYLIESNWLTCFFWTKFGENFEQYQIKKIR